MWHPHLYIFFALLCSGFAYGHVGLTNVHQECAADNAGREEIAVEEQRVQELSSLLQSRVELERNTHPSEQNYHKRANNSAATQHGIPYAPVGSTQFYEALLPARVDFEQEGKLRADMAANPLSVHLVEQHHQSMHWWIRKLHGALERQVPAVLQTSVAHLPSATSRRLLVHADTHGDIGTNIWQSLGDKKFGGGRAGVARLMAETVDIGNFIGASAVAGMVTDMIWVRSCFPQSVYNGPGPGHFLVGFFVAEDKESVCQKIIAKGAPSRQLERDRELNISADDFNTCTGSSSKLGHASAIATMNLTVTSLEYLEQDVENMLSEGNGTFKEWMLDVDQDFFASIGVPGWKLVEHFLAHGVPGWKPLSRKQIRQVRSILVQLGDHCDLEDEKESILLLLQHMQKHTGDGMVRVLGSGMSTCSLPDSLGNELASLAKSFSKEQWKTWAGTWAVVRNDNFISDTQTAFFLENQWPALPDHRPDQEELRSTLDIFEGKVRSLYRRLGTPMVVTLCRSLLNGYLPRELWPQIESGALRALRAGLERPALALDKDGDNPPEELYQNLG